MHFISSLAQVKQKKIVKNYIINRTEKKKEKKSVKNLTYHIIFNSQPPIHLL